MGNPSHIFSDTQGEAVPKWAGGAVAGRRPFPLGVRRLVITRGEKADSSLGQVWSDRFGAVVGVVLGQGWY